MVEPAAIATWEFGEPAVREAYRRLADGESSLDAAEAAINITELDTSVTSVGYGGYPNDSGVVELDAAIMYGLGHRAGSVASLHDIRTPISVARKVMERSRHVMLVGEGARQFALANGFIPEETLTDSAARAYHDWIDRGRPAPWLGGPDEKERSHDTIGLITLDQEGRLCVGCSTSGLAFKSPGRVGDSPIIGAGLYADQDVGAATATGVGEIILRFALSHAVVEEMARGQAPQEACYMAIQRILKVDPRYAEVSVCVIALSRDGAIGAATTQPETNPFPFAVASASGVTVRFVFR